MHHAGVWKSDMDPNFTVLQLEYMAMMQPQLILKLLDMVSIWHEPDKMKGIADKVGEFLFAFLSTNVATKGPHQRKHEMLLHDFKEVWHIHTQTRLCCHEALREVAFQKFIDNGHKISLECAESRENARLSLLHTLYRILNIDASRQFNIFLKHCAKTTWQFAFPGMYTLPEVKDREIVSGYYRLKE